MILAVVEGVTSPPQSILDIVRLNIYHFFMKLKVKILSVFILLQLITPGILLALEPAPDITALGNLGTSIRLLVS